MKSDFFARRALLILCVLCFLIPFAMRGARMSWERMENNVKDWLPNTVEETKELAWFGQHFVGEQSSVLLTWEGCSENDESYRLFVQKLRSEIQPENEELIGDELFDAGTTDAGNETGTDRGQERTRELTRGRQWGDQLGLYVTGDYFFNWGGLNEKWLRGTGHSWYYITPSGELFRWHGSSNIVGALSRLFQRKVLGDISLNGAFVARFGRPPTAGNTNGFHDDPQRLAARVLRSVTTGPEVLAAMSAPGGSMWPAGDYSDEARAQIARRGALDRLKGTFFGPEPYAHYAWTADDLPRVLREATFRRLPKDWRRTVDTFIENLVRTQYDGERSELLAESLLKKEEQWNAMFADLGIEPPGLQTCILVTLSAPGMNDLDCVMGRGLFGQPRGKLVNLAVESGVLAPPKPPVLPLARHLPATGEVLRMGGPVADNVAFDEEGQITLVRLAGSLAVLGVGLGYFFCFRRITAALMILTVSSVSALASLSIVWWTGNRVDAVLWLMPPLMFVLGLAGAVHLFNYYRETSSERGVEGAPWRALTHAAAPCTLAAVTMAVGLLALCTSDNDPIRKFGLFSALGVLATLVVLFTFLPSALQLWPLKCERAHTEAGAGKLSRVVDSGWRSIGNLAVDHNWWVAGSAVGLMVALGLNLGQLRTSVQPLSLFGQDTKIIRDYRWLETNVGKSVPMEVVIAVDKKRQCPTADERKVMPPFTPAEDAQQDYQYNVLERIELVRHVQDAIDKVFGEQGQDLLGPGLSAVTFTPPALDPLDAQRAAANSTLEQYRDPLRKEGYLALTDEGTELWRISVRLSGLSNVDYGRFVAQLRQVVEPVLKAYEFRDEILRKIADQHQDAADPRDRWNDTKIAILGASDPRDEADDITAAVELPEIGSAGQRDSQIDTLENDNRMLGVHREFAKVLSDLLRAKGYQGKRGGRTPGQYIAWQNPRRNPLKDNARSEAWAKHLASFDCVVVLRNHADYDMDFIRQHAKCVVDATQHGFDPVNGQTAKQLHKPIEVTYTGMVPVMYRNQQTLLRSLIDSSWWAFVAIAVVMMVVLRTRKTQLLNFRGGLAAMIPAIFPVIVVFGEIGRRRLVVDIGTLMTVGVAMAVTVVGTFQFLTWFQRSIREGLERRAAIKAAYGRGSGAILRTTVIGGLGLSLFALGTFVPTQRFGITMLALLVAALVANLVLLPALLAGPLGRYLCPRMPSVDVAGGSEPASREALTPFSLESSSNAPAGLMHNPPREGRAPTVVRRDGSHS
jgi:predicted RND superfamily exporter protein